jgi:hypothetical protein
VFASIYLGCCCVLPSLQVCFCNRETFCGCHFRDFKEYSSLKFRSVAVQMAAPVCLFCTLCPSHGTAVPGTKRRRNAKWFRRFRQSKQSLG